MTSVCDTTSIPRPPEVSINRLFDLAHGNELSNIYRKTEDNISLQCLWVSNHGNKGPPRVFLWARSVSANYKIHSNDAMLAEMRQLETYSSTNIIIHSTKRLICTFHLRSFQQISFSTFSACCIIVIENLPAYPTIRHQCLISFIIFPALLSGSQWRPNTTGNTALSLLGRPLQKVKMANQLVTCLRIYMDGGAWQASSSMGSQRVGQISVLIAHTTFLA